MLYSLSNMGNKEATKPLFEYLKSNTSRQIINGDALQESRKFEEGKFDLIITSPPYNVGKAYEIKQ